MPASSPVRRAGRIVFARNCASSARQFASNDDDCLALARSALVQQLARLVQHLRLTHKPRPFGTIRYAAVLRITFDRVYLLGQ
jgi:hypothetical protein